MHHVGNALNLKGKNNKKVRVVKDDSVGNALNLKGKNNDRPILLIFPSVGNALNLKGKNNKINDHVSSY